MSVVTPWGPLGYITTKRTYMRPTKDGKTEEFPEAVERIIKATDKQIKCGFTDEEKEFIDHALPEMERLVARFTRVE